MRYAQRAGYTPGEQRRREQVRLRAAERRARGDETSEIADDLRVTARKTPAPDAPDLNPTPQGTARPC
ncbi:MAG TPA: hypothetical protein VME19_02100 [Streptosporangiaceae bacterium]|nr:hypothetical protein [Streptosporangiaceae bacterium]